VNLLARKGIIFCLVSSLNASSKGCTNPTKETLLGPTRLWNKPITFRSNKVKKATERRISRQCSSQQMKTIREYPKGALLVLKTNVLI
jgi:hypothetical protein